MNRTLRYALLLCLTLIVILQPLSLIEAQESTWQRPFEVSKPQPAAGSNTSKSPYSTAWFPNLAVGPEGSVHVIWYSGIQRSATVGDSVDLLMYRVLENGRWSDVNNVVLTADGGYTVRNGIAFGPDGRLHVTLRSYTEIKYTSAPWKDAWSAQAWSSLYPVSGQNSAYYNSMAIDSHNTIHIVWSEAILDDPNGPARLCRDCANLFYRRSSDGGKTWSPPINLSNSLDGDNRPQIVIDSQDRIHVAWDNGRDWYAGAGVPKQGLYRRSDDGGQTWSEPISLAPSKRRPDPVDDEGNLKANPDAPQQTTLAVRPNGNPIVVYRTVGGEIYYQLSNDTGDTWSAPRQIASVMARDSEGDYLDKYSMVTDGAGNIHLLMVGFQTVSTTERTVPSLLHLVWNGRSWSRPETVLANDLYPEYPTAAISGSTLHVVYFTRSAEDRFTSDRSHYRVWYTSRPVRGAAIPPIQIFTPVPTVEILPTAAPTATPAPTMLPTAALDAPALDRPPAWEAESVPLILMATIPTVLIIGLLTGLIMVVRRRRR